MSSKKITTAVN